MNRHNFVPVTRRSKQLLALCLFVCGVMFLFAFLPHFYSRPDAKPTMTVSPEVPQYYAALSGSHVAIYLAGSDEPIYVTDVDIRSLPRADQTALSKGIPLDGMEAVQQLLEDYDF